MSNKVRYFREKNGYTQAVLAEKANVSLRTVQRVESSGIIPKGYTLNALAAALEINKSQLQPEAQQVIAEDQLTIKLINLSALSFVLLPFGNMIVPLILWNKNRSSEMVDEAGRRIINFQLIWSAITYASLIISPFLQRALSLSIPLILFVAAIAISFNIYVIAKTALSIGRQNLNILNYRIRIL